MTVSAVRFTLFQGSANISAIFELLAMKVAPSPELAADAEREAEVQAQSNHPNIATIYAIEARRQGDSDGVGSEIATYRPDKEVELDNPDARW
jgi:hypothetical protein